jgi:energy-coupling factor transport system ATP-binding protein
MIELKNVVYTYSSNNNSKKLALDNVNIVLKEKKMIGLIGNTGAGKTTFVQHLAGLLKPTHGSVFISDDINVGLVFQNPRNQIFCSTVYEEMLFGLKNSYYNKKKHSTFSMFAKNKIIETLKVVGFDESFLDKNPFFLSGGEKKRLAIADILVLDPNVLILDEPTAGLDMTSQNDIIQYIKNWHETKKNMTIIISHDMNLIAEFTEKVIIMSNGKIIFYGDTWKGFDMQNTNLSDSKKLIDSLNKKGVFIPSDKIKKKDLIEFLVGIIKK